MRGGALIAACLTCLLAGQALAQDAQPVPAPPTAPLPPVSSDPVRVETEGRGAGGNAGANTVTQDEDGPGVSALVVPSDRALDQFPILTIDRDRLFAGSAWGRRIQAGLTQQGSDLSQENERLVQKFSEEEEELTRLRDTLPAEEFRIRADEFDRRVVEVRRQRDLALQNLQQLSQKQRDTFYEAVMPVIAKLMLERQAAIVLDERVVLIQAQSVDVTDELIARIDAEMGEGPGLSADPASGSTEDASSTAPSGSVEPSDEQPATD